MFIHANCVDRIVAQAMSVLRVVAEAGNEAGSRVEQAQSATVGAHPDAPETILSERGRPTIRQRGGIVRITGVADEAIRGALQACQSAAESASPQSMMRVLEQRHDAGGRE